MGLALDQRLTLGQPPFQGRQHERLLKQEWGADFLVNEHKRGLVLMVELV